MGQPIGITEPLGNGFAKIKESFVAGSGKLGIEVSSGTSAAAHAGSGVGAAFQGLASPLVLGGFAGLSAIVNQMEYMHERDKIASFYDEELAAKLRKSIKKVGAGDLDTLESGDRKEGLQSNHTIKEALTHERWKRNVGIAASFVASLAVFTLMHAIMPGAAGVIPTLAKVAVSVLSYMAIKSPIAAMGNSMLGLNKETTHEKIVAIAKGRAQGKSISREQVTEVFVSGNKDLSGYVHSHFGKKYDDLALADKVAVAQQLSALIPIETITQNINAGVTNASELAFTVEGQISGVLPKRPEERAKPSMISAFGERCQHLAQSVTGYFKSHKPVAEHAVIDQAFSTPAAPVAVKQADEEHAATNFAGRFAKTASLDKSQVERLAERARAAQIIAPSTQTIQ